MSLNIYLVAPGLSCWCEFLVSACVDLVGWSGIESRHPALGARSLSHWTTREVPTNVFYKHVPFWFYRFTCIEQFASSGWVIPGVVARQNLGFLCPPKLNKKYGDRVWKYRVDLILNWWRGEYSRFMPQELWGVKIHASHSMKSLEAYVRWGFPVRNLWWGARILASCQKQP